MLSVKESSNYEFEKFAEICFILIGVVSVSPKSCYLIYAFGKQGHFLRAAALENLGNYCECLRSYLKAYELDTAHPTELLLRIIQAVGCICQMSETEELCLAHKGEINVALVSLISVLKLNSRIA